MTDLVEHHGDEIELTLPRLTVNAEVLEWKRTDTDHDLRVPRIEIATGE